MAEVLDKDEIVTKMLVEADELILAGKTFLAARGKVLDLSEWITVTEYAKKHRVTTQVVSKWIERGIIPEHGYIDIPELRKKLVRDVPYRNTDGAGD